MSPAHGFYYIAGLPKWTVRPRPKWVVLLEWLKHRARFSKLDQGILYDWIGFAYKRIRQQD